MKDKRTQTHLHFENRRDYENKRKLQTIDVNLKKILLSIEFLFLGYYLGPLLCVSVKSSYRVSVKFLWLLHLNISKVCKNCVIRCITFYFNFVLRLFFGLTSLCAGRKKFLLKAFRFIVHISLTVPVKVIDK